MWLYITIGQLFCKSSTFYIFSPLLCEVDVDRLGLRALPEGIAVAVLGLEPPTLRSVTRREMSYQLGNLEWWTWSSAWTCLLQLLCIVYGCLLLLWCRRWRGECAVYRLGAESRTDRPLLHLRQSTIVFWELPDFCAWGLGLPGCHGNLTANEHTLRENATAISAELSLCSVVARVCINTCPRSDPEPTVHDMVHNLWTNSWKKPTSILKKTSEW